MHYQKLRFMWLVVLLMLLAALPTMAQSSVSEDITVPEFTCNSIDFPVVDAPQLIEAIEQANNETACPGPDVIDLGGRTITLTTAAEGFQGVPIIDTTMTIQNGVIQRSSAGGTPIFRIFFVEGDAGGNPVHLTLRGITVRNGRNPAGSGGGGAVFVRGTTVVNSVTLIDSALIGNSTADQGGAIFTNGGIVTINNSTLNSNIATGNGGAIYAEQGSIVNIHQSNFAFNQSSGLYGGAIALNTDVNFALSASVFRGNRTVGSGSDAAAIGADFGSRVNVVDSEFFGNVAGDDAGAVAVYNGSNLTMLNTKVQGNIANDRAGGLYIFNATTALTNVLITGNVTGGQGGGMWVSDNASATTDHELLNMTIAGNRATSGGGYYHSSGSGDIDNSIFWGNGPNQITFSGTGSLGLNSTIIQGGLPIGVGNDGGNLVSNPNFVSPRSSFVAPTAAGDYRVFSNSPAVNAGNNGNGNVGRSITEVETDLGGDPRIQNGTVDMGVYETTAPALQAETNFLSNPSFTGGFTNWLFFGQGSRSIVGGEARFYRTPGFQAATLFQQIGTALPAGTTMEASVFLGNTSSVPKGVEIVLRPPNFSQVITCAVTIPPNSPLRKVTVRNITNQPWASMVFSLRAYDPDGIPAIRVDNADVRYRPTLNIDGYSCEGFEPSGSTELLNNGDFSNGLRYWTFFGGFNFNITGGVMNFWRTNGAAQPAVLFQNEIGHHLPAGSPLRLAFQLGNSSNVTKNVEVFLRDVTYAQSVQCNYVIPPNTPLTAVTIQVETTTEWARPLVLFRATDADGLPAVQVDNVSLLYLTSLTPTQNCFSVSFGSESTKIPTTILPDAGPQPDSNGAAPAPIAPPNPGSIPEIPGF